MFALNRLAGLTLALAVSASAGPAAAAVTAAPGWVARAIPTPGMVQGGVVQSGDAILVGQGSFGAGQQHVIRLDGGAATTIATGFNALGGFELDAGGTLYLVDNGGDLQDATTGDTVYAIPEALTRTTTLPAAGAEIVAAGSIASPQDVVLDGGALVVSDAVGPGAGRVVRVSGGTVSNLITGLDYASGLAIDGTRLLVGNVDGSFVGSLAAYTLAGAFVGPIAGGLSGAYAHALDGDGNILVTGGFRDDFSSSNLIAIAPGGGGVTERAWGFGFSAELFHDAARDETLVLDSGASEIAAICRDRDGDGICDADQACRGGVAIAKARLALGKLHTPVGDDRLVFQGEMTIPTSPALDPVAGGARLLVADVNGTVADVTIPSGARDPVTKIGWKPNKAGTAWTYTNKKGVSGIVKVIVKAPARTPGVVKFAVTGKHGAFPASPASLPLRATFTLNADGRCGEVDFSGPRPTCAFKKRQRTVKCQ